MGKINVKFADRKRYYDAFEDYAASGSPKAMTNLVAEYLKERMSSMLSLMESVKQ